MREFLAQRKAKLSFNIISSIKPSNITDKYQDSDNGDCVPMLGKQCVKALADAADAYWLVEPHTLSACRSTLDLGDNYRDRGESSYGELIRQIQ